jgi:hypothetical protein
MENEEVTGQADQVIAEKPAAPAAETNTEKPSKVPVWAEKRFAELTAKNYSQQQKIEAILAENAKYRHALEKGQPLPPNTIPADQVARLVKEEASRLATKAQFDERCDRIYKDGEKQFPDWRDRLKEYSNLGGLPDPFINAAYKVGNPELILYHLAGDLDEAERIIKIQDPLDLAIELGKLQRELTKRTRTTSNAPKPLDTLNGKAATGSDELRDDLPMAEWVARRDRMLKAKGQG